MIYLHPDITFSEAIRMAGLIDARLVNDREGNFVITPISAERHGNGHVAKVPHHQGQFKRACLPAAPEIL